MDITIGIKYIRARIAQGQLKEALRLLCEITESGPENEEALQLSGRYETTSQELSLGKKDGREADAIFGRIRMRVLEILDNLDQQLDIAQATNQGDVQHPFNKRLFPLLIQAMASYNEKADRLSRNASWLDHPEDFKTVQIFVFQHFIGELGKQLRELVNIGDYQEMAPEKKRRAYIDKILDIARRTFDLLNYALLSAWWDYVKVTPLALHSSQRDQLASCFDKHFEYNLEQQFQLLQTLVELFQEHAVPFPFQELPDVAGQMAENGEFHQACKALQHLSNTTCTPADCDQAESLLGAVLFPFGFLTLYRMASIKKIHYRQIRHDDARYMHRFVALGLDNKYSEDAEKLNYCELGEYTPAVLLYRGDNYQNGLNLFPFIIDYNALTLEPGAKVCFFSTTDLSNGALKYRFLGDNSIVRIQKTGIRKPETDLNELLLQPDNIKLFNLDCVVDAFRSARRAILAEEIDLDEL